MNRRTLLQLIGASVAWTRWRVLVGAQTPTLASADEVRLRAVADVVLPTELSDAGRRGVVEDFVRWTRNYRAGAEMDHGYGLTRLRQTPASPAARYPTQLAALDRAARTRGASFETLDATVRREIVEASITAARVDRLPVRPTGDHVATDLMAFYFHSPAANDVTYRAAIGRDHCRGLQGSDLVPTRVRPAYDPDATQVRPAYDHDATRVRPGYDPGTTLNRPGYDPARGGVRAGSEDHYGATQLPGTND